MRYLYYIAGIIIAFSGLAAYGLMNTQVEISKPALVVNDRIMSQAEVRKRLQTRPYYMDRDQYLDSIVTEQLLIQEAMKQKINKEESFRQSIEQYYEQSLIKILLDRKLSSLDVSVSDGELKKYRQLSQSRVIISKFGYKSIEEAAKGSPTKSPQPIESDFIDISDDLKFILISLEKGELSPPVESGMGVMVYRLDDIMPTSLPEPREEDMTQVKQFILDKKRELLMEAWTRQLKEKAQIWREK